MKLLAMTLASLAAGFSPHNRLSLYKRNLKRAMPMQEDNDFNQVLKPQKRYYANFENNKRCTVLAFISSEISYILLKTHHY